MNVDTMEEPETGREVGERGSDITTQSLPFRTM